MSSMPTGGGKGENMEASSGMKRYLCKADTVGKLGAFIAGVTNVPDVEKTLERNEGWEPFLFADGPHMFQPVMIFRKEASNGAVSS